MGDAQRVWTKHGSTRHLFCQESLERAVDYVVRMQDVKPGRRPDAGMHDSGSSAVWEGERPGADA